MPRDFSSLGAAFGGARKSYDDDTEASRVNYEAAILLGDARRGREAGRDVNGEAGESFKV